MKKKKHFEINEDLYLFFPRTFLTSVVQQAILKEVSLMAKSKIEQMMKEEIKDFINRHTYRDVKKIYDGLKNEGRY